MVAKHPWAQPLQISPEQIAAWRGQAPEHESLLAWCFEKKKVSEQIYLAWAQKHYQLPIVREEFFDLRPSPALFEKVRSLAPWSRTLFPVAEWDGVVFVACLEPADLQLLPDTQFRYVLAPLSGLTKHWDTLTAPQEFTATAAPAEAPAQATADESAEVLELPPVPMSTQSMIMGGSADDDLILIDSDPTERESSENSTEAVAEAGLEKPEGLDLDWGTSEGVEDAKAASAPLDWADPEPAPSAPPVAMAKTDASSPGRVSKVVGEITKTVTHIEANPAPGVVGGATVKGKALDLSRAPQAFSISRDEDEAASFVLAQFMTRFAGALILHRQGHELRPWRWPDSFEWQQDAAIPLDKPSLFKIAFKSRQPYHGPVVSNGQNDAFFRSLGFEVPPAHVTAQPIVAGQDVVGILVGFGDAGTSAAANLQLARTLAEQMASRWPSAVAKAA
jgi:hypothetical protein